MPDNISIHDNYLVSYSVSAKDERIVLHTEFRDRDPHEYTDVIFENVLAYDFYNDLFETIIFDVEEVNLEKFVEERSKLFEDGWLYGWPRGWEPQKESIAGYIRRLKMKPYELSSSYGMSGWIIASSMRKIQRMGNAPFV